jgi:hypothetical protein
MPLLLLLSVLLLSWPPAVHAAERWVAPLAGRVVVRRAFAPPSVRWGPGHRGVDLAARAGAPVRAVGAGSVTYAGTLAGRGVLTVTHGALRTTYEPVSPLVPVGSVVAAGEVVALLDAGHAAAGRPGEEVLHWGLLRGEAYLDPLSLLDRGPSRLLPVAPAPRGVAPDLSWPPWGAPDRARATSTSAPRPEAPGPGRGVPAPVAGVAVAVAGVAGVTAASRRSRASP